MRLYFAICGKESARIVGKWFQLSDLKGRELPRDGMCKAPSAVNVPWCETVRSGSVVHDELNHVLELSMLIRETLANIPYKQPHEFLSLNVLSFHQTLLHWSPWGPKASPNAEECCILVHQRVLELWAPVCTEEGRNRPAAKHTFRKHAPSFHSIRAWRVRRKDALAERTNVRHGVAVV